MFCDSLVNTHAGRFTKINYTETANEFFTFTRHLKVRAKQTLHLPFLTHDRIQIL